MPNSDIDYVIDDRRELSKQIALDVEAFLKKGGEIQVIDPPKSIHDLKINFNKNSVQVHQVRTKFKQGLTPVQISKVMNITTKTIKRWCADLETQKDGS